MGWPACGRASVSLLLPRRSEGARERTKPFSGGSNSTIGELDEVAAMELRFTGSP